MSESGSSAEVIGPPLQLVRLAVDKPQPAVAFLQARSRGVMDLIAHFWEGLSQTPPLQRGDLHLVVASPTDDHHSNVPQLDPARFSGAMLYVPKAHRADVLALDPATAAAFASYISHQGTKVLKEAAASNGHSAAAAAPLTDEAHGGASRLPLTDLSAGPARASASEMPAEPEARAKGPASNGIVPIDFLTGHADGISWMTPLLLPLVHKRAPARQLVNVVMQLPAEVAASADTHVRLAREADVPVLNRWRRQYKEERGILFDADMDAWIQRQRIFVYEIDKEPAGATSAAPSEAKTPADAKQVAETRQVVAVAKVDLELQNLVEIGGVYTFPEFRHKGYGAGLVGDIVTRIRQMGKQPTLQVDEANLPALHLYEKEGWKTMGKLARVWLTG